VEGNIAKVEGNIAKVEGNIAKVEGNIAKAKGNIAKAKKICKKNYSLIEFIYIKVVVPKPFDITGFL